jgi:hypothetical protein
MKVEVNHQIAAQLEINPPRPRLNPVLRLRPAGRGALLREAEPIFFASIRGRMSNWRVSAVARLR